MSSLCLLRFKGNYASKRMVRSSSCLDGETCVMYEIHNFMYNLMRYVQYNNL